MVAVIREMLMTRRGEVITEAIALERANNIVAWLEAERAAEQVELKTFEGVALRTQAILKKFDSVFNGVAASYKGSQS